MRNLVVNFWILFSVFSLKAMELEVALPEKKIPSLKKLCIKALAKKIQTLDEAAQFEQKKTNYHRLPSELQEKIMSRLPDRFRVKTNIKTPWKIAAEAFHPSEKLFIAANKCGGFVVIDIHSGQTVWEQDNLGERRSGVQISWSSNGDLFVLNHGKSNVDYYMCSAKDKSVKHISTGGDLFFSLSGKELLLGDMLGGYYIIDVITNEALYNNFYRNVRFSLSDYALLFKPDATVRAVDLRKHITLRSFELVKNAFISKCGGCAFVLYKDRAELVYLKCNQSYPVDFLYDEDGNRNVSCGFTGSYFFNSRFDCYELFSLLKPGQKIVMRKDIDYLSIHFIGQKHVLCEDLQFSGQKFVIKVKDFVKSALKNNPLSDVFNIPRLILRDKNTIISLGLNDKYAFAITASEVTVVDMKKKENVFSFADSAASPLFSLNKKMFFASFKTDDNIRGLGKIICFDNDLTIDQFLLQQLIITNKKTEKQIINDEYLNAIYQTLSDEQKVYFKENVFKS